MIPGKALQVRSRSQIHAPFLAGRGHEKIAPGGKCLLTHILETPTRIFPREGDDSVPSPILTRVKICGCRSRAPFTLCLAATCDQEQSCHTTTTSDAMKRVTSGKQRPQVQNNHHLVATQLSSLAYNGPQRQATGTITTAVQSTSTVADPL